MSKAAKIIETVRKVSEHPLIRASLNGAEKPLKDITDHLTSGTTGKARPKRSPADEYYIEVLNRLTNIIHSFDRLAYAAKLMTLRPDLARRSSVDMSRNEWIEYHFSYYVMTYTSFPDMARLLVNSILRLGLPPQECRQPTVDGNLWVKGTPIANAVNNLEHAVKRHRPARNLHQHRGEVPSLSESFNSRALFDLSTLEFIGRVKNDEGTSAEPLLFSAAEIQKLYRLEIAKIAKTIDIEIGELVRKTLSLFDTLLPRFQATKI